MMILKKILHVIIIGEFVLTSLGFCGHTHDEQCRNEVKTGFHVHFFEQDSDHSCSKNDADQAPSKEENHSKKKIRCSCHGGFIGEMTPMMVPIFLESEIYSATVLHYHYRFWIPQIYRPPKQMN